MTASEGNANDFWDDVDRLLSQAPMDLSIQRDSFYSQPDWHVFQMRYSGLDGYRLFAWLSVPVGTGPFPALVRMPDYGSVHDLIYTTMRSGAVVMNPTYRGQRNSDLSFQAHYPGLLTEGIGHPQDYIMRRAFADGIRAMDAVLHQTEAQITDVALTGAGLGASLALAAAARRSRVKAVAADTPLALGNSVALSQSAAYPLEELTDYLRANPEHRSQVAESAAPLDPVKFAQKVSCPVLLSLGRRDRGYCPLAVGEELAAQLADCDLRVYEGGGEGGGYEHDQVRTAWLKQQLGLT
jgi:cephalosporin-C deacetylase